MTAKMFYAEPTKETLRLLIQGESSDKPNQRDNQFQQDQECKKRWLPITRRVHNFKCRITRTTRKLVASVLFKEEMKYSE